MNKPTHARPGSSPQLLPIAEDAVAPGAVREYRPPPIPHDAPPPSTERRPRPTNPPPAGSLPPPLPAAKPVPRSPTQRGMPAPPSEPPREREDGDRDSTVAAVRSANSLADELAEQSLKRQELEREKAELAAQLDAARRAPTLPQDVPTRAMWHSSLFKLLGVLTLLGAAATGWIEVHTANVSTHVDNLAAKQVAQEVVTDPLPARVAQLEAYLRLKIARDDCVEGELRSALDRATGHAVTALHETAVQWVSESMPPARAPLLWPRTVWFPSRDSDCPPEPRPP